MVYSALLLFLFFSITCEGRDTITREGRVLTHSNAFECVTEFIASVLISWVKMSPSHDSWQ